MSLKKLSEDLGLSQTTVSRALNGYPEVSEATRSRVVEAAAKANYSPNQRAVSLATGRSMAIGHVIPIASQQDVMNPIFAEFIAGASQTYAQHGYEMKLTVVAREDEAAVYRKLASKRSVDGLIVHLPLRDDQRIKLLNDIGIPYLVHGRVSDTDEPYSWVDMNSREAFQQATELLIELGHKKIALINGSEDATFAWYRRIGFQDAMQHAGLPIDEHMMFASSMTESYGYTATESLIKLDDMPTAILVSSYIAALGVRRALGENGFRVGDDVSVITHDDDLSYFDNSGSVPQFTSTRSSVRKAGVEGAKMLLDLIADPSAQPEPRQQLLQAELVMGASTGPVPSTESVAS